MGGVPPAAPTGDPLLLYPTTKLVELDEFVLMKVIPIHEHKVTLHYILGKVPGVSNPTSKQNRFFVYSGRPGIP
jgi:hypothetical protein